MSTAEIIAELPRLTEAELALVQARLRELIKPNRIIAHPPHIRSPRLARLEQAKDFIKQVIEISPDAQL